MSFVSKINLLEELFECPVCMEKLGYANKVLPCQHTLCISCICQIHLRNYKNIQCPECRKDYHGKIEDLPANIFLIRMLDKIREMEKVMENKTNFSAVNNNLITEVSGPSLNPASYLLSKGSYSVTISSSVGNELRQNQPFTANRTWLARNMSSLSTQTCQRSILKATRRLTNAESNRYSIFKNNN